jgi:hypothetical protein
MVYSRVFEASKRWLSTILLRGYSGACCRCNIRFRLGDKVISRNKRDILHRSQRHYHKACWEAIFI